MTQEKKEKHSGADAAAVDSAKQALLTGELPHDDVRFRRWFRFLRLGPRIREIANAALLSLTIANQLRALRRRRGWSRVDAAKRMGIHWLTLARYEWALAEMTLTVLKRMARVYDVALVCRYEAWSVGVTRAVIDGYTPRDVLRWRRGVREPRSVAAPPSYAEDVDLHAQQVGCATKDAKHSAATLPSEAP